MGIPHGTRSPQRAPWEINLQKAGKIGRRYEGSLYAGCARDLVPSLLSTDFHVRILYVGDRRWGVEMMAVMVCLGSSDGGCAVYFTLLYFAALRYVTSCGSAMI